MNKQFKEDELFIVYEYGAYQLYMHTHNAFHNPEEELIYESDKLDDVLAMKEIFSKGYSKCNNRIYDNIYHGKLTSKSYFETLMEKVCPNMKYKYVNKKKEELTNMSSAKLIEVDKIYIENNTLYLQVKEY